jgi:hypothetical protein
MQRIVPSQIVDFIDRVFPRVREQQEGTTKAVNLGHGHGHYLAALLDLLGHVPDELLQLGPETFGQLVAARAAIVLQLQRWVGDVRGSLTECGYGELNPVTLIRRAIESCPDEAVPTATADMAFVKTADLRTSLRADLATAEAALTRSEWKTATVLAGSIVEALLLDALVRRRPGRISKAIASVAARNMSWRRPSPTDLDQWSLDQYVEVARELGMIKENTRVQCLQAKDFRNLIHPGRAQRKTLKCSRGTAFAAVSAVALVTEDREQLG